MLKGYRWQRSYPSNTRSRHVNSVNGSPYRGNIDNYIGNKLYGWVVHNETKEGSVPVGLFVSDELIEATVAGVFRADVRDAGIGDGVSGFEFIISEDILDAAGKNGGEVSVRALSDQNYEIGTYDMSIATTGELKQDSPFLVQCRQLLSADLRFLVKQLIATPKKAVRYDQPDLLPQTRLFSMEPTLPTEANNDNGTTKLHAYLEYTKFRYRQEREFDTEENPEDQDHFLNWYLSAYAVMRNGLRVPLSRELIAYLNEPIVIGGQSFSLSRAMWWSLAKNKKRLEQLDLSNIHAINSILYWWAAIEAKAIFAEDCLVPTRYADLLRAVRNDQAFPLSIFMEFFHKDQAQFHFLDLSTLEGRQIFTLGIILMSVRQPHLLRYIPRRSIVEVFAKSKDGFSPFENFCQALSMAKVPPSISFDQFAAIIREQGYDLYSHSFLSITEDGHRLEAAALPCFPNQERVDVQLIGPFEKASGLGQATRLSATILQHTDLKLNCVNFGLDNPAPEGFSKVGKMADYSAAKVNLIHLNAESIPLVFAYGPDVFSGSYNIGYFYWELDSPALCHYLGMDILDEIWVSTDYGVEIYKPETNKPVINVGMCYEELEAIDRKTARSAIDRRFRLSGEEFVFLVAFDSFSFIQRKNPIGVLKAFQKAFQGAENVRLIIKTQNRTNVSDPVQTRMWNRIDAILGRDPRIIMMNETLPYEKLLQLKAASDCYISLHKSEGWGFGMIEAMNLKVPVVCTAYSGNLDFCSEDTAWLVDYDEVTLAADDYIFVRKGQKWAEPDISDAAAKLYAVYSDPASRIAKAEAAFMNVRNNFSPEAISKRYATRLNEILSTL